MRIVLWLIIAVFISGLFWPQLLNNQNITYCCLLFVFLLALPRVRFLAVIPLSAVYFTLYANLTLTGIAATNIRLPFVNANSLQTLVDGQNHNVIVQVNSLISYKNNGYFTAKLIAVDGLRLNYSPQLAMRWYSPTLNVQEGEQHQFSVRFKPLYGYANPAGFDRQKWFFSEHIAYQASIKKHLKKLISEVSFRAYFYQKVQRLCVSLDNQGVILALSFADKTLISTAKKELIKKLAISHLFAISGLHIGLFFSCVHLLSYLLLNRLLPARYLGWNSWRFVNISALLGAFFYAYLAGFSLPTQRAFIMLLLAVLILSMKRRCTLFDLLSITLFVILLWDPLAVLSLSLWLSFVAVTIILTVLWCFPSVIRQQKIGETSNRVIKVGRYFKFLFLIQLSLVFLMLPMQLLNFSAFNLLSPLINFIAVPLFALFIIPLILLGAVFSLITPSIALFFLSGADYMISLFFTVFRGTAAAYQSYSVVQYQLVILFISVFFLLFIIYFQARNNQKTSFLFASIVIVVVAISLWQREKKVVNIWFIEGLDVGQGLSVLVRNQGKTLLYDTGPRYPSGFTAASSEIVPYLNSLGIERLDNLVVSHSDIDHAGGVAVIMEQFKPKQIWLGESLFDNKNNLLSAVLCQAGQKWKLGSLSVEVLSPLSVSTNNNNNSCVLRLSDGNNVLLLTGDIDKKQEQILIEKHGYKLQSDLLFAPHHGSKHSSSEAFIKTVSPQWVVFSAGFMNHWGFPAEEVKLRYKNQFVKAVNSGVDGFVRFKIEKGQIKMQTYREDLAAYWYHHCFSH